MDRNQDQAPLPPHPHPCKPELSPWTPGRHCPSSPEQRRLKAGGSGGTGSTASLWAQIPAPQRTCWLPGGWGVGAMISPLRPQPPPPGSYSTCRPGSWEDESRVPIKQPAKRPAWEARLRGRQSQASRHNLTYRWERGSSARTQDGEAPVPPQGQEGQGLLPGHPRLAAPLPSAATARLVALGESMTRGEVAGRGRLPPQGEGVLRPMGKRP